MKYEGLFSYSCLLGFWYTMFSSVPIILNLLTNYWILSLIYLFTVCENKNRELCVARKLPSKTAALLFSSLNFAGLLEMWIFYVRSSVCDDKLWTLLQPIILKGK